MKDCNTTYEFKGVHTKCHHHGDWLEEKNTCSCDWGWYDGAKNYTMPDNVNCTQIQYCNVSGDEVWDESTWKGFKAIFTILHIILFVICLCKLYNTLSKDKIKNARRLCYRMFRSPRNLCLIFLVCIGFLRILWLSIDPFSFDKRTSRTADRLLYESVYPFIYGLYSSVLLVWGGLYQGMRPKSSDPFKILRKVIMIMMVAAFPVSLVVSILKGQREYKVWTTLAGIFVSAGIFTLIIGFVVFGVLLFCYVEKKHKQSQEMQKSNPDNPMSSSRSLIKEIKPEPKKNLQPVLASTSGHLNHESQNKSDSWLEFMSENQMIESESLNNEHQEYEDYEVLPKKKDLENSKTSISLITDDDRIIFRKLCLLLMISILLGILVLILMMFLNSMQMHRNSKREIALLYFVFFIELFACWMIFFVFTAQIKVKEKNNLRFFSLVSMKMNKKEPKISLPPILKNIQIRLRNFYS